MVEVNCVIVDIDDTLIDTKPRTKHIMEIVLEREIPLEDLGVLTHEKIFLKYASEIQRTQAKKLTAQFLNLLLCKNEAGIESLKFNRPIPHAAEVLQIWENEWKIVYLTGRLNIIQENTLRELEEFGFPTDNSDLIMFDPADWGKGSLLDARKRLLSSITEQFNVIRVVDDFPGYFSAYKQFLIPDRIGLNQSKVHTKKDFFEQGATRVIEKWIQLRDESEKL